MGALFQRYWNGTRRKLPIISDAPATDVSETVRRPPYSWNEFAPTQFWKNPRRQVFFLSGPRKSQPIKRLPSWSMRWTAYDTRIAAIQYALRAAHEPLPPVMPFMATPGADVAREHWLLDMETGGFWPLQYADQLQDPTAICAHAPLGSDDASDVLLGGRDGIAYQLDRSAYRDDGHAFTSYVMIGPLRVGTNDGMVGLVEELEGCTTDDSGHVTWSLRVASNYEDAAALATSVAVSGTWSGGGLNAVRRPRRRGAAFSLVVTAAETNDGWSIEEINSVCSERGMRR